MEEIDKLLFYNVFDELKARVKEGSLPATTHTLLLRWHRKEMSRGKMGEQRGKVIAYFLCYFAAPPEERYAVLEHMIREVLTRELNMAYEESNR